MTTQGYRTSITVDATPAQVFDAVTDVRGWWANAIKGDTRRQGDEFVFEVPGVHRSHIRLTEVVPGHKIVWHVLDNYLDFVADHTEWTDTEIHFEIVERDGATELRFTHIGLVPAYECFDACTNGWAFYIQQSLKDLITTGEGKPSELPAEVELVAKAAQG
jgi:uncharacterized protein YndB with AHSA1/START domain